MQELQLPDFHRNSAAEAIVAELQASRQVEEAIVLKAVEQERQR